MTAMNRAAMMLALASAMFTTATLPAPARKGKSGPPPVTRYKKKPADRSAKEARRAARQANDKQTMERQRAKWGTPGAK